MLNPRVLAVVVAGGIKLCISSKHFLNNSTLRLVTPVTLPPVGAASAQAVYPRYGYAPYGYGYFSYAYGYHHHYYGHHHRYARYRY